jgi:hypothetical protein
MRSFSIVIPSYNGLSYMKQSVSSALAQTYAGPFTVEVLDDASSDGTLEYLKSIRDDRLKVHATPNNLGIKDNWRRMNTLPLGEYVTIFGQDDLVHPNYLELMDELIGRRQDATLYHTHFNFIDKDGNLIRRCRDMPEEESAGAYLTALFSRQRDTHGAGYMFSRELFHEVGGVPDWHKLLFADDALWILLMERGRKVCSPETAFSIRLHQASTGSQSNAEDWLVAMQRYITFLREVAARDLEFAAALQQWVGSYYLMWADVVLEKHLVERTRQNLKADPTFLNRIRAVLEDVDAGQIPYWGAGKKIRVHRLINRSVAGRSLYKVYGKIRGQ